MGSTGDPPVPVGDSPAGIAGALVRKSVPLLIGSAAALERLLRPLPRSMTAELARALVNLRADQETQVRYEELAEKRAEGRLTESELEELEAFVRANTLLGLTKAEAQSFLTQAQF